MKEAPDLQMSSARITTELPRMERAPHKQAIVDHNKEKLMEHDITRL